MAEETGLRNSALPYPVYGVPFGITFPLLDADGDPISPSSPDSEVSKNGDTFADCTNEATEIATSSGICYLLLTATEMTADVVTVRIQSTGAKTTVMTLYPRKLVTLNSGTVGANAGDGTTLQLASGAVAIDDYYNGCLLVGTIDTVVEARVISDYVGSTLVCTVSPAFNTAPDNNDTYVVYMPEGRQVGQDTVVGWVATALPSPDTAGYPKVTIKDGTGTGEIDTTSGGVLVAAIAANAITATSIAADAITDAKVASDVTIASVTGAVGSVTGAVGSVTGNVGGNVTGSVGSVAAGGITASSIAADAIGASELAADAVTEIANAVWDMDATGHQTQGTFGQAIGDPAADTGTIFKATVTDATGVTVGTDTATLLTRMGTPSDLGGGATVAANLADIESQTDDIGVAGAGLTAADDAVIAAIGALNNLSQANVRSAVGLASANLDTQLDALPTAAENTTAVWAAAARTLTTLDEDSTTLDLDATIRSAVGMASANLDTQLDALPTNAELATALGTADDAVLAAIAALNNLSASAAATAVLTTQMTEAYAADGAAPTLAQALHLMIALLSEFAISGTTLTAKKLDGSTTAATFTLDSATSPTSITRAT